MKIDWDKPLETRLRLQDDSIIWVDAKLVYKTNAEYIVVYAYPTADVEHVLTYSSFSALTNGTLRNKPADEPEKQEDKPRWRVIPDHENQMIKIEFDGVDPVWFKPDQCDALCSAIVEAVSQLSMRTGAKFGVTGLDLLFNVYADLLANWAQVTCYAYDFALTENADYHIRAGIDAEGKVRLMIGIGLCWKGLPEKTANELYDLLGDELKASRECRRMTKTKEEEAIE